MPNVCGDPQIARICLPRPPSTVISIAAPCPHHEVVAGHQGCKAVIRHPSKGTKTYSRPPACVSVTSSAREIPIDSYRSKGLREVGDGRGIREERGAAAQVAS